jgi:hypothetical protein
VILRFLTHSVAAFLIAPDILPMFTAPPLLLLTLPGTPSPSAHMVASARKRREGAMVYLQCGGEGG